MCELGNHFSFSSNISYAQIFLSLKIFLYTHIQTLTPLSLKANLHSLSKMVEPIEKRVVVEGWIINEKEFEEAGIKDLVEVFTKTKC